METVIAAGRLTVNGRRATVGQRVGPGDRIVLDGRALKPQFEDNASPRVLLYHKPAGELVTERDPKGRPTVFENLPRIRGSHWIAIGRLDFNTGGLLLFTDSGELANRLMHPKNEIEREYAVRIRGELLPSQLQQLEHGIMLDDGPAKFDSIAPRGGQGSNRWYQVSLCEGRNREVRRMFEALGITVSRLMRVRFGPIPLPSSLRRGQWRALEGSDLAELIAAPESAESVKPGQPAKPGAKPGAQARPRAGRRPRR
jgi:23S rRNA pseudouridine2605 synthase